MRPARYSNYVILSLSKYHLIPHSEGHRPARTF